MKIDVPTVKTILHFFTHLQYKDQKNQYKRERERESERERVRERERERDVPYSQLTLDTAMLVTHIHRTYKEHRNLKIRKHVTTSCSGTKAFY